MAAQLATLLLDCLGFRDLFNLSHFAALRRRAGKTSPDDVVQIIISTSDCQLSIINILYMLNLVERPFDIAEQVGLRFEPGREAHQAIADAEFGALFGL